MPVPHIVFITCHDLGRYLGCYGHSARTPALDALAAEGVRFTRSFCTSPGCSPSRAAIATGRYPHCNGVLGLAHAHFGWELAPDEKHAARLLSEAGYHTVLFGLQHVTFHVESLGFRTVQPARSADEVAQNVERLLRDRSPTGEPLYLEINFFEPHRPFDFGGVGPDTAPGIRVPPFLADNEATRSELALMQGAIHKVDLSIARIREALRGAGILEDTLLVFTADHGIAFPGAKGTLYDPGIETALIMSWPAGGIHDGTTPDALISNVDLLPTLLELAGAPVPENIQGRSFRGLLLGSEYRPRAEVFAEKTFHNEYDPIRCVRTERFKLIARFEVSNRIEAPADVMRGGTYPAMIPSTLEPRGAFELYDLEADPVEQNSLAYKPEWAEVRQELTRTLAAWMRETDDPLLKGPVASPFYYRTIEALANQ